MCTFCAKETELDLHICDSKQLFSHHFHLICCRVWLTHTSGGNFSFKLCMILRKVLCVLDTSRLNTPISKRMRYDSVHEQNFFDCYHRRLFIEQWPVVSMTVRNWTIVSIINQSPLDSVFSFNNGNQCRCLRKVGMIRIGGWLWPSMKLSGNLCVIILSIIFFCILLVKTNFSFYHFLCWNFDAVIS